MQYFGDKGEIIAHRVEDWNTQEEIDHCEEPGN